MYNTRMMNYMERTSPETALENNTPCGIGAIRKEIKEDIALLLDVKESFDLLGMNEESKWCLEKAAWMAKWLIKLGAF